MGKTGLIRHCFANPRLSEHYYTFLIDIYATKTLQDMVYQLGHGIVRRLKPRGQAAIDKFLQVVTSLRTGISFDGQGNASWNLGIGDIKSPVFTLEEIFSYLQSAERPCIVAIDEFQAISQYQESNVEAMLRTYVQQCRNAVFVFSGSQPSMMSEMFSSPARPFYQSVSLMFLKPVPLEAYEDFAKKHFLDYGKDVADGVVSTIYERFDGITWYIQKISYLPLLRKVIPSHLLTLIRLRVKSSIRMRKPIRICFSNSQLSSVTSSSLSARKGRQVRSLGLLS